MSSTPAAQPTCIQARMDTTSSGRQFSSCIRSLQNFSQVAIDRFFPQMERTSQITEVHGMNSLKLNGSATEGERVLHFGSWPLYFRDWQAERSVTRLSSRQIKSSEARAINETRFLF